MAKQIQTRLDFERVKCKRGKELAASRKEIMDTFQYLTRTELRRHHLPYYICTLKDLEDTKFTKSFEMLLELLIDNEEAETRDTTGFVQRLMDSNYVLDVLKDTLVKAETAECDKDLVKQCKILSAGAHRILDIGLGNVPESGVSHLNGKGWFWLVLRLLEIALDVAETVKIDGGEREAVQRYMLAKLLLNVFPEDRPFRAETNLKIARHMSLGMDHWKMDEDEGDKESTLSSCISWLMADMYIAMGRFLIDIDPQEALEVCEKAVKRARESNNVVKLGETLIRRGFCYMKMNDLYLALDDFLYVLCLHEKNDNIDGICEAHVTLSVVYQKLKKIREARQHLEDIIIIAREKGLRLWQAMAYWRLGELLLKESIFEESSHNFWIAYELFGGANIAMESRKPAIQSTEDFFHRTPRKTLFFRGAMAARRSSMKFNIYDMKDRIMNKRETVGFLYIPGPSKPAMKLQASEYRTRARESMIFADVSKMSLDIPDTPTGSRRSRRSTKLGRRRRSPGRYFLDDNEEDPKMNTYLDTTNKEELNVIRCQYGIAKAHEYLNIFFEEVGKCQSSMRARHRIISWKLNTKPFWENRDQSEEKILPNRPEVKIGSDVSSEGDISIDWSAMELPKKSIES